MTSPATSSREVRDHATVVLLIEELPRSLVSYVVREIQAWEPPTLSLRGDSMRLGRRRAVSSQSGGAPDSHIPFI